MAKPIEMRGLLILDRGHAVCIHTTDDSFPCPDPYSAILRLVIVVESYHREQLKKCTSQKQYRYTICMHTMDVHLH